MRKPKGYWQKEENVLAEARKIMAKHDLKSLPCHNKLIRLGYGSFSCAIFKYHGGFPAFRKVLGEEQKQTEKGAWKDLDYTIEQAKKVMEENNLDILPTHSELGELGYSGLGNAITKYHGGVHEFRKILGEENIKVKRGLWKDLSYTISEAKKFMEKHGFDRLPHGDKLRELGYNGLCKSISIYHGGFPAFRKILGEESKRVENGLWKSLDYTIEQARKFLEEHPEFDHLPNQNKIKELNSTSLVNAIQRYHGGFPAFRIKLNEHLGIESEKEKLEELLGDYAGER